MLGKGSISVFWGHIKWGQSVTVQARMWVCKFPSGSHHWGQETALGSGRDNSCSQREEEEMAAPFSNILFPFVFALAESSYSGCLS